MSGIASSSVMLDVNPTTSPSKRKRPYDDEDGPGSAPTQPSPEVSNSNGTIQVLSRAVSPSLSSSLSSLTSTVCNPNPALNNDASPSGTIPQKRRKLTPAEKEQRRAEKEAKLVQRAEQRAKREEEKRGEEQEKQRKRAEREEKKRQRDLELLQKQQEKDRAKQAEDEARQKKERSQLRLNAFFAKPQKIDSVVAADAMQSAVNVALQPTNHVPTSTEKSVPDWERTFLPFCLAPNGKLASQNAFLPPDTNLDERMRHLDQQMSETGQHVRPLQLATLLRNDYCAPSARPCLETVENLLKSIHESFSIAPSNPDHAALRFQEQPTKSLQSMPMRYIHFEQDVRPPYYGTFSKFKSYKHARKLGRAPCSRSIIELNYDYDSEAEWEEPEEGEDIGSDADEDAESNDDEDDMEEFLDDENDMLRTRKNVGAVELEPVSTGLCWEDPRRRILSSSGEPAQEQFKDFKMGVLLEHNPASIDPYSTVYWQSSSVAVLVDPTATAVQTQSTATGLMQPPARLPLQTKQNGGNAKIMEDFAGKPSKIGSTIVKPPKRMIPPERMADFKQAVEGSDMTKIALIEALKKQFPSFPKDAISHTLSCIAARLGAREVDKRWVVIK